MSNMRVCTYCSFLYQSKVSHRIGAICPYPKSDFNKENTMSEPSPIFKTRSPSFFVQQLVPQRDGYLVTAGWSSAASLQPGVRPVEPFQYHVGPDLRYSGDAAYDLVPNHSCVKELYGAGESPMAVSMACGDTPLCYPPFSPRESRLAAARDAARKERDGLQKMLDESEKRLDKMTRGRDGAVKQLTERLNELAQIKRDFAVFCAQVASVAKRLS